MAPKQGGIIISKSYFKQLFSQTVLFLIILSTRTYNCSPIDHKLSDISQLREIKLLKDGLIDIKKNIEAIILHIDEWAIHKAEIMVNSNKKLKYTDITSLVEEVSNLEIKLINLRKDLDKTDDEEDLETIRIKAENLQEEIQTLDEKFDSEFHKTMGTLGENYDEYFSNIINLKQNTVNNIKIFFDKINKKKEDMMQKKVIAEIVLAIRQENYEIAAHKLNLIKNNTNLMEYLKIIVNKVYNYGGFELTLNFAEYIQNVDDSFLVFKILYNESKFGYDLDIYDKIKFTSGLNKEVLQYVDNGTTIKSTALNMTHTLKVQMKNFMKSYFKNNFTRLVYDEDLPKQLNELDDELLFIILEELFNETLSSETTEAYNEIYTNYLLVLHKLSVSTFSDNYLLQIKLTFLFKNQYSILQKHHSDYVYVVIVELENSLPLMLGNLLFRGNVCIKNVDYSEYLDSDQNDGNTSNAVLKTNKSKWIIQNEGRDKFYINSVSTNQSLYADSGYYKSNGRQVYTKFLSKHTKANSLWKIELTNPENCYIKSVLYDEYLYASRILYSYEFNVYTSRALRHSLAVLWKIENC